MNKPPIESIEILCGNYENSYSVGRHDVSEIKDCSVEWPDHFHNQYDIIAEDGKLLHRIENVPVVIHYKR